MKKRTAEIIRGAVRQLGTYDPTEIMPMIEEELTIAQGCLVEAFLDWCNKNDKRLGQNILDVYAEFTGVAA